LRTRFIIFVFQIGAEVIALLSSSPVNYESIFFKLMGAAVFSDKGSNDFLRSAISEQYLLLETKVPSKTHVKQHRMKVYNNLFL